MIDHMEIRGAKVHNLKNIAKFMKNVATRSLNLT